LAAPPLVSFQRNDVLGEIAIDSPPGNLFSGRLLEDLGAAVAAAASSDVRAVVVRAEGDDFSAGADASVFGELDEPAARELQSTVLSLIGAIEELAVPTLALIHGQCYAGALEVCLACDLIWAAEGSQIGQIEAVAGGVTYGGGTQRIAARVGVARAAEMVFTAAVLGPEILASWGLVSRVVPAENLVTDGSAFARSLAAGPTRAHSATKRMLHAWRSGGVAAADEVTRTVGPEVMLSEDLRNGLISLQRSGPGHAVFHNR